MVLISDQRITMFSNILMALILVQPSSEELLCLSCTNVAFPTLCNHVAKCGNYEECYMEQYADSLGIFRYDLGCKDSKMCALRSSFPQPIGRQVDAIHTCTACCNDTLCNLEGCGSSGIAPRNQRGPLCFECQSQLTTDGCSTFIQCGAREVCVLDEHVSKVTGQLYYATSCMRADACDHIYNTVNKAYHINGKRYFDHSAHVGDECKIECCDGDLCNRACNITKGRTSNPMSFSPSSIRFMATTTNPSPITQTISTSSSSLAIPLSRTVSMATPLTLSTSSLSPLLVFSSVSYITSPTSTDRGIILTSVSSLLDQSGCVDHIQRCADPNFHSFICNRKGLRLYCPKSCKLCGS